jgi:hypothetical protein
VRRSAISCEGARFRGEERDYSERILRGGAIPCGDTMQDRNANGNRAVTEGRD